MILLEIISNQPLNLKDKNYKWEVPNEGREIKFKTVG